MISPEYITHVAKTPSIIGAYVNVYTLYSVHSALLCLWVVSVNISAAADLWLVLRDTTRTERVPNWPHERRVRVCCSWLMRFALRMTGARCSVQQYTDSNIGSHNRALQNCGFKVRSTCPNILLLIMLALMYMYTCLLCKDTIFFTNRSSVVGTTPEPP